MSAIPTLTRILAAPTALVLATGLALAPASAEVIESDRFHEEFSGVNDDFCGVSGWAVAFDGSTDGRFQVRTQGRDGLVYVMDQFRTIISFTDVATGQTATHIEPHTIIKDLHVTENPDGTLTIIVLGTGGGRLVGEEGTPIAKFSGQVRWRIVYDPATDTELSNEVIFGSTGTNDDTCVELMEHWGVTP
jgi:hypothetical protein